MCKLRIFRRWLMRCAAALSVFIPATALAASGYATATVNLRAGPGTEYPIVDTIPGGDHVDILGCLDDHAWCDVSWNGDRGWVSAGYLDYLYNNRYVYLPDYYDVISVPVVTFSLDTYWGDYYRGRPWYGRLAYWRNFWRAHGRYGFYHHGHQQFGSNFEHRHQALQGGRPGNPREFRNPHEVAGNVPHQHVAGRRFQGHGGRFVEHAPVNRHIATARQFAPHFHHQGGAPRFASHGPSFARMGHGMSAQARVGSMHVGGAPHFGGGGGGPHFGGGGGGRGHRH